MLFLLFMFTCLFIVVLFLYGVVWAREGQKMKQSSFELVFFSEGQQF